MAMLSACGNKTEFSGKAHTEPSTITVCQSVPTSGRFIIVVDDGIAEQPVNILGSY
jgi:hypothetical protein